ncbi:MAG: tetratricopeptide repeat protein [Flavobacteriaceae bacterium]
MSGKISLVGLFLASIIFTACATTKDGLFRREYHTLTTKFNVLFNGQEAFEVGSSILKQAHDENFFEILPLEPISLLGEDVNASTVVPGFARAEEKAVKAIQKHSMNIDGQQRNRKIDEAYLLLGKARYFDRRFFPALEAFNFLLESEADYKTFVEGRIWRERTNMRLNNNAIAIQNLKGLAEDLSSKNKFFAFANVTVGEAYLNLKKLDSALYFIKRAAMHHPKKKQRGRSLFVLAQLYEQKGNLDSARWAYDVLLDLKRKSPRNLFINAQIRSQLYQNDSAQVVNKLLKMLGNYENEPYIHAIYRGLGQFYSQKGVDSAAIASFNQSLHAPGIDPYTKKANYTDLADYMFAKGAYVEAGAYLDSLIPLYKPNELTAKRLIRKRDNLSEVLLYETQKKKTDSVLQLLALSYDEQIRFFEAFLDAEKEAALKAAAQETKKNNNPLFGKQKQAFYFYNPNLLVLGKQDFLARWGTRPNADNWRTTADLKTVLNATDTTQVKTQTKKEIEIISPEAMASKLPTTQVAKDSIKNVNQNAYLQLGLIYKEKFDEIEMAVEHLETFLRRNPTNKKRVEALYHLYKVHENRDIPKANKYKDELIQNFPESTFATFLSDPQNYDDSQLKTPSRLFENAYRLFEAQQFSEVLKTIETMEVLFSGSVVAPKVALLKANTVGRLQGVAAWKEELIRVADVYGTLAEGKHAQSLLSQIESSQNLTEKGPVFKNYKWIFPFDKSEKTQLILFNEALKKSLKQSRQKWQVSVDPYDHKTTFVVVHGIFDPVEIETWLEETTEQTQELRQRNNFVALSATYRDYQKNKTWIK